MRLDPNFVTLSVLVALLLAVGGWVSGGTYLSPFNLQSMAMQLPEIGFLAIGVMLAMCAGNGGIDLSGIANANMSGVASGIFTVAFFDAAQQPVVFTAVFAMGCMIVGTLGGVLNGLIISKLKVTPILCTLGTQMLFTGVAVVLSGGRSVAVGAHDPLYSIGNGTALGVPIGFLSQRWRNGRFGSYATRKDLVTGLPFVDDAQTLRAWLAPNGRTFVLTDYRLDLHLDAALRETVEALPLLYRSDLSRLRNLPEHPEWEGQTHEYRIYLSGERSP